MIARDAAAEPRAERSIESHLTELARARERHLSTDVRSPAYHQRSSRLRGAVSLPERQHVASLSAAYSSLRYDFFASVSELVSRAYGVASS